MIEAAPTILSLETDSSWAVIVVVSMVTLCAALLLKKLIRRPGGLAAGVLMSLPLVLPLVAAAIFEHAVLPEIAILRPAGATMLDRSARLLHLLFVNGPGHVVTPYALAGSAGPWLLLIGLSMSSFMLLRRSLGAIATHRLIKRCSQPGEGELFLEDMIVRLSDAARLSATPALAVLPSDVSGAFVVGARRRWILLSRDLIDALEGEELEGIIAHEIAHLKARDVHVVFGAGLLRDMVAWNPIGHIAFRRLVADRELEADRRAAAMTGRPLAVASGLLKVCELMRSSHGLEARATVAMARPGGRVARRVARLIDISDGKTAAVSNDNRLPYLMAALLVAVLGLQVGARMANDHIGALAVVWGTQPSNAQELWRPEQMGALRSRSPLHPGPKATSDDRAALLKNVLSDKALAAGVALKERDVHRWMEHVVSLARRIGIPAQVLRYEFRQDWQAEPLFESRLGSLTRMQRLPP